MIGSLYYVPGALIAKANTDDFRGFNGLSYIPQDEFNAIHWLSRQEKKGNGKSAGHNAPEEESTSILRI